MDLTGDCLIGASAVRGPEPAFRATNPAVAEPLEPAYGGAGQAELERACALAWSAL